jgi:broad specificity phosphatase PhoE
MGSLFLVRHGQASFGAADYDQLSPLGERQCEALGAHWAERGRRFDAVLTGTLKRHRQSLDAIVRGHAAAGGVPAGDWPAPRVWPGLDEYDPVALVKAIHPLPLEHPRDDEAVKRHFRLLREGLLAWMAGRTAPEGLGSHTDFVAGVRGALDHVRTHHADADVLVVSSGGPISHAAGLVLDAPASGVVELNLRIRNSAVAEFAVSSRRVSLVTWNTLPHLDHADRTGWITHA